MLGVPVLEKPSVGGAGFGVLKKMEKPMLEMPASKILN